MAVKITVTMPDDLAAWARQEARGNVSGFVTRAVRNERIRSELADLQAHHPEQLKPDTAWLDAAEQQLDEHAA